MDWTKEQSQAIEIRNKSILVSAAAGSGKTAVLVERIKQIIVKDGLSLDEILVVTFTNAAASEMKEKIVSAIPDQMHQIHNAHISTFHSFALDVIRRYFHLVDIEPGFKICDDAQRILLQNEAMERLFSKGFEKGSKDFLDFLRLYGTSRSEDSVKTMILNVHNFLQSLPDPYEWLEDKVDQLLMDEDSFKGSILYSELMENIKEETASSISKLKKVLEIVEDNNLCSLIPKAKKDLDMVEQIYKGFPKTFDEGRRLAANATFERFVASKQDKVDYLTVKEDIGILRDRAKKCIRNIRDRYCKKSLIASLAEINQTYSAGQSLKALVESFNTYYNQEKRKRKLVDFSDIEHLALDILSRAEPAQEYRNKFKYIFIDEYQDSNLIQEAIISRIQRKDNVFMVGDVKQSIYKFRLAEPEIFIKKYEKFKDSKKDWEIKLDLNRNFRSKGPIIDVVNHLFVNIMNHRNSGMEYDEGSYLYKGVGYNGPLDHEVEFHVVDDMVIEDESLDDEIKDLKKTEIEAITAARLIKKSIGMPYYDTKTGQITELRKRDMVILLRSTVNIADIYREALESEGIPAYMDTGDGYFDSLEISVFVNLLRIIDNRKQDVPLLSVLRSPIFAFSIADLALIRSEFKEGSYFKAFKHYSEMGSDIAIKEGCIRTLKLLDQWKKQASFLSLSHFVWKLILETGYYNYIGALPGGAQRQANLRALSDKALKYENNPGIGLFGFINYIEAIKERKIASAPMKLIGEGDDVVRIMTVHKSKGLEYPYVLFGGLGRLFHREAGKELSLHKELGLGIRQVDGALPCYRQTMLQNLIEDRVDREAIAEEIRILYVALTRAKDKLVLLGTGKDVAKMVQRAQVQGIDGIIKGNSYLDYMLASLSDNKRVKFYIHERDKIEIAKAGQDKEKVKLQDEMEKGFAGVGSVKNTIWEKLNWTYGYPSALGRKSKYSVSELTSKSRKRVGIGAGGVKSKSTIRGNAYHIIMEHIPLNLVTYSLNSIEEFANELVDRDLLTEEEKELIDFARVVSFFHSPMGARLCKAEKVYRETAFNMKKDEDGEEIIIQGIIDCYFKEKDKLVLVDFKTDYTDGSHDSILSLVESYRPQLKLYKEALNRIRKVQVKEAYLYLFHINKAVKVNI